MKQLYFLVLLNIGVLLPQDIKSQNFETYKLDSIDSFINQDSIKENSDKNRSHNHSKKRNKLNMNKISKDDLICQYLPANYIKVINFEFESEKKITPDDIQIAFWTNQPKWINNLFKIRGWIVKPLGLKSGNNGDKNALIECIKSGGEYDFISVPNKSQEETVLSMNDSHLVMYYSVKSIKTYTESTKQKFKITLLVKFHNVLGRIYFYMIYPLHIIIIKSMLNHTIKNIK